MYFGKAIYDAMIDKHVIEGPRVDIGEYRDINRQLKMFY